MNHISNNPVLPIGSDRCSDQQLMEFHISAAIRKTCSFDDTLFSSSGNVIFRNISAVQDFAQKYNKKVDGKNHPERYLRTGQLNAMGLLDEIFHYVCRLYREKNEPAFFTGALLRLEDMIGLEALDRILLAFVTEFPPRAVYRKKTSADSWLEGSDSAGVPHRAIALEELVLLRLANENPALETFSPLFSDESLKKDPAYQSFWNIFRSWSAEHPPFGPENRDLVSMLKAPVDYSPFDLKGQLEYVRTRWADILGEWLARLLSGLDLIAEEEKPGWGPGPGADGYEMPIYEFDDISKEYERFSPDRDWMPNVVMIAKSTLVWLDQLSRKYNRPITRLDQIPDEELDFLEQAGFTGLWLIGLWERSPASARIKQICGNPEAAASAYSLNDYEIAEELGGWAALDNLRSRAWSRGIRMASDMVPNHTGMDSSWVVNKPDLFIQTRESPFPGYDFSGENLSHDDRVGIYLENHYYSKTDCAVVFKRVDHHTGDTRYIYHGNDGTGMPWNDTAQIDFLNPEAREAVIQKILHVASNFPIIRFDAAMVLAKKHIQRLWYPEPGKGGDIASRSRFALSRDDFERRIPEEFWREVVDRCAKEIPDTLLLAEAFWMMEGYFVRTLGMHRVYNSAFMNMLKREENDKYRSTIKNTIEFDPEILKRYVNFMNNPDEETAVAQFGRDDKYFGVCTMMAAMPGLPMFGHGQVEGFEEKYGMEYRKAYRDEQPDNALVARHHREIFPLMKKRYIFAGVEHFHLYDFWENGTVNENVFAWTNRAGTERALILYNNAYQQASGWIQRSAAYAEKLPDGSKQLVQKNLWEGLGLTDRENRYCIMQEQRSRLWFIRTVREIVTNGFFAALNGFQTQVFLNIQEIDDNEEGHYRQLHETLGGAGIPDIHMGIQNIVLRDLYTALSEFISPDYIQTVRTLLNPETKKIDDKRAAFFKTVHKSAIAFFAEASRLPGFDEPKSTTDKAFARYRLYMERLFAVASLKKNGNAKEYDELLSIAAVLFALRHVLAPPVTGAKCRKLISRYDLDRKMIEILSGYGFDPARTEAFLSDMGDFLTNRDLLDEPTTATRWISFFNSAEIQRQMNVHPWDKILWFGKEQSEHMIELLRLSMVLFRDCDESIKSTKTGKLEATLAKFTMLFADSGYQFEKLIEGITGKKPGKTASSKKAATGTTEAVVPPGNTTKKKKP
ncbi:MAG TPA: alpha-amylase family glycosyl hydrolase [Treponemataceae bacterium]|nr:MAG: Alpha amylase, catalytic domain [Spirochaetes bacterium ADurb.Bin215]HPA10894.1 alpha-amylase family glycosyl hydrolase [Treponemataceae bacterium]